MSTDKHVQRNKHVQRDKRGLRERQAAAAPTLARNDRLYRQAEFSRVYLTFEKAKSSQAAEEVAGRARREDKATELRLSGRSSAS